MRRVVHLAYAWSVDKIKALGFNPYSDTNILHRDRLAGIQFGRSGHKILCYDPPEEIKEQLVRFDIEWKQLCKRPKQCIYLKYVIGGIPSTLGHLPTARQLARANKMSLDAFDRNVQRGLKTMDGKLWPK